ncbi:MAG: outer membrane beta-barrel protein [Saprospiraceae bacterium]|nr:outer membrane beta-barrel protein [Saprospiraceae bacterium]
MKRVFIIILILLSFRGFSQVKSNYQTATSLGLNLGANYSQLEIDTIYNLATMLPFMGLNLNYEASKKFNIIVGGQLSYRGSNTISPVYKYRNEYVDVQLLGQYKLADNLALEFGIQRSTLLSSYKKNPTSAYASELTTGFSSHNEFITGLEIKFHKNVYLSGRYTLPTKELEYSNLQFLVNIRLRPWLKENKLKIYYDLKSAAKEPLLVEKLVLHRKDLIEFPMEILEMKNLQELVLDANKIISIPPEIDELINLTYLSVKFNDLDSIPKEIGNLKNLKELHLENNDLKKIPPEIGNLENLEFLYIEKNDLNYLPPEIGKLENLKELNIAKSGVALTIPIEYKNLKQLDVLTIDYSLITTFNLKSISSNLRIIVK